MSFLVSEKIDQMNQELTTVGQLVGESDWIVFLNRTGRFFKTGYKMPTSQKEVDKVLFPGVKEYPLPSDYLGIIEPKRPYELFSPTFTNETEKAFIHWPYGNLSAIKWDRETPYLIAQNESDGVNSLLNNCDSTTENGAWVVSGDGSALAADTQIFTEGTASLRFLVAAVGGTTTLTLTGMDQVDITQFLADGMCFMDIKPPDSNTTAIPQVLIRLGSDNSNYYEMTTTLRYRGDSIISGWGQIGFDFMNKTTVGTPDYTAIDYIQIVISNGTDPIVNGLWRIDWIFCALGTYFQLPYYSKYNVRNTQGAYIDQITAASDTVLCPSDFDEAFSYKALEIAAATRLRNQSLASYFARELAPKLAYLKSKYPTQESKVQTTWYDRWNTF